MNKKVLIAIVAVILIVAIIIGAVVLLKKKDNKEDENAVKLETVEEMKALIDKMYGNLVGQLPSLQTYDVNKENKEEVSIYTGLKDTNNVDKVVVSEPMMNAQAYSLVMVKTAQGADIEAMKQEMIDNIDVRKWICVSAEKVYVTNYKDVIFLVMSSDEWAKPVYDEFKNLVGGKVGKELVRTEEF